MKWWNASPLAKEFAALASLAIYRDCEMPIVVASTGRSGSTMLTRAIMQSLFEDKFKTKKKLRFIFFSRFQRGEGRFYPGGVHKTHLLADAVPENALSVFIYDNPVTSRDSFNHCVLKYGEEWGKAHLKNLESSFGVDQAKNREIDILNYESQVKSWAKANNTIFVRFEDIWNYAGEISAELGINLVLPDCRQRTTEKRSLGALTKKETQLLEIYNQLPPYSVNIIK